MVVHDEACRSHGVEASEEEMSGLCASVIVRPVKSHVGRPVRNLPREQSVYKYNSVLSRVWTF